jgi:hypothetical protein
MMGPQFNVYSKLTKMKMEEVRLYPDGTPEEERVTSFYSNPEFPAHISGLDTHAFYRCTGKKTRFGAANYEEYCEFKNHLAKIVGFNNAEDLWLAGGPIFFIELIHFSNYEGTIGPIVCRKLYNDFKDNYDRAEEYFIKLEEGKKFWIHYQNWCKALGMARNNGAILIT